MLRIFLFSFATFLSASLLSQSSLGGQVLFSLDGDTVLAEEYIAVYNKNRQVGEEIDPKSPSEYLDLYVNFKLKVHEAKALGRDTLPGFKREYRNYRDQLAKPYLSDKDVTEDLIREAYSRMKYDQRASHIMIKLEENASPEDTAAAFAKIAQIRADIIAGKMDFATAARKHSDDTYSAQRDGDLGFFTVFNMVYPFETAAYETPQGKISAPVRSPYGYHIVKPTDRRPARGTISVAHLMLIDNEKAEIAQHQDAEGRIREIHVKLEAGEDWAKLVQQYSEDKTSAAQMGLLDPFGINKMYPEFEEAAFALQDSGDYSAPVKTPVGWHIIFLVEKPGIPDFNQAKADIRNKVERDVRAMQSQESVMKRLKRQYQFKEFPERYAATIALVDNRLMEGNYQAPSKIKGGDRLLFSFAGREYKQSDFLQYVANNQKAYGRSDQLKAMMYRAMRDWQERELLNYEKSLLADKYPEFRLLDREYYEGILLFDLTEEKVWRKAMRDTAGLESYFAANQDRYQWEPRFRAIFVDADSKKLAKKARKCLKKGWSTQQVSAELNRDSKLAVRLDSGFYQQSELPWSLADAKIKKNFSAIEESQERYRFAYVMEQVPAGPKSLAEARGPLLSDYQNYLESEWIKDLRARYPVKINTEVLEKVIAELEY